jgi:ribose 5-phosphate isomerase B
MTANKYQGVRAALAWTAEIAGLSREHNNANVVCLPARFIEMLEAKDVVKTFIETSFEGGRHERRVNKIVEGIC